MVGLAKASRLGAPTMLKGESARLAAREGNKHQGCNHPMPRRDALRLIGFGPSAMADGSKGVRRGDGCALMC